MQMWPLRGLACWAAAGVWKKTKQKGKIQTSLKAKSRSEYIQLGGGGAPRTNVTSLILEHILTHTHSLSIFLHVLVSHSLLTHLCLAHFLQRLQRHLRKLLSPTHHVVVQQHQRSARRGRPGLAERGRERCHVQGWSCCICMYVCVCVCVCIYMWGFFYDL